jgi:hypothetical protein
MCGHLLKYRLKQVVLDCSSCVLLFYGLIYIFVWVKKSRRIGWAGHVAWVGQERGMYRVLVGKPEEKRLLRRPRCR